MSQGSNPGTSGGGDAPAPGAEGVNRGGERVAMAVASAFRDQPKQIRYPDYRPTEDFTLWLSGYRARVTSAYGFKPADTTKIEDEIIRSISGKLAVGAALDAYDRLEPDDKNSYAKLVEKLTEEFLDPHEKRKFNENFGYNTRHKGQSIKEFLQEVKKDMTRYSRLPEMVVTAGGGVTKNPAREAEGVRRFKEGMRDEKGKVDDDLADHLDYHLMEDTELTWSNAIKVASRWEMARTRRDYKNKPNWSSKSKRDTTGDSDAEDKSSDSDEDVKAVEGKSKKGKKKEKKPGFMSALADRVHENQMKIEVLETTQERMLAAQEATNCALQDISAKMDIILSIQNTEQRSQLSDVYWSCTSDPVDSYGD